MFPACIISHMKELTVRRNDAGQRLDRFVGKAVPLLPETLLQKYIRIKRIKLNGKGAKRDTRLNEGDVLSLYINDEFFEKPREENAYLKIGKPRINIVYEDENILLADKKPGVLCHSAGAWDYNTLIANIQAYLAQKGEWNPRGENSFAPALCNRIDRNTGGIVIAAKNAETLRILNDKIRDREIEKYYLCAVQGKPRQPRGRLENYLFKDTAKNQVYVKNRPEPGAKTAVTEYRLIKHRARSRLWSAGSLPAARIRYVHRWLTPVCRFSATGNTAASASTKASAKRGRHFTHISSSLHSRRMPVFWSI